MGCKAGHEVRMSLLDTNPVLQSLGGIYILVSLLLASNHTIHLMFQLYQNVDIIHYNYICDIIIQERYFSKEPTSISNKNTVVNFHSQNKQKHQFPWFLQNLTLYIQLCRTLLSLKKFHFGKSYLNYFHVDHKWI